jgi:hypothetical protein
LKSVNQTSLPRTSMLPATALLFGMSIDDSWVSVFRSKRTRIELLEVK